ncbi:DUF6644 family protein [Elongatibacter sediminis]|uniref:DUF6644 family protein n=1 Tax=Elongatibacter sediminis TaxID=3119006 RepID=A0AAW9RAJ5_9GAMM
MLDWLESTAVARMVQETMWGYPIVLSSHAVGMAILAGIVLMMNFRVLGLAPGIPLDSLRPVYRVALIGLVINVISGTMLFVANASGFVESTPFWLKMAMLVVGITLLIMMKRRMFASGGVLEPGGGVKAMAALSSVAWLGVIVMGRLIAYWDVQEFY